MSNRDVYIAKMKLQLDELNLQMGKVEIRAKEAREDVREKYKEEMVKLRAQSRLAVAKLEEMQTAGETSWDSMVGTLGFDRIDTQVQSGTLVKTLHQRPETLAQLVF